MTYEERAAVYKANRDIFLASHTLNNVAPKIITEQFLPGNIEFLLVRSSDGLYYALI